MRIGNLDGRPVILTGTGALDVERAALEGARNLFTWSPPSSFLRPEDLAALTTGPHARA